MNRRKRHASSALRGITLTIWDNHYASSAPKGNTLMKWGRHHARLAEQAHIRAPEVKYIVFGYPSGPHLVDQNTPTSHDHETDCKECQCSPTTPSKAMGCMFSMHHGRGAGSTTCAGCDPDNTKIKARVKRFMCRLRTRQVHRQTRPRLLCAMQEWQLYAKKWHVYARSVPGADTALILYSVTSVTVDDACFNCTEGTCLDRKELEQCGLHILPQRSLGDNIGASKPLIA